MFNPKDNSLGRRLLALLLSFVLICSCCVSFAEEAPAAAEESVQTAEPVEVHTEAPAEPAPSNNEETQAPVAAPADPTEAPATAAPTQEPTAAPVPEAPAATEAPAQEPTAAPAPEAPEAIEESAPEATEIPVEDPTAAPEVEATEVPVVKPTAAPTAKPTEEPEERVAFTSASTYLKNHPFSQTSVVANVASTGSTYGDISLMQTSHNITGTFDRTYVYKGYSCARISITFSGSTYAQSGYVAIGVYNYANTLIGAYTGSELAGKTITMRGNIVKVRIIGEKSSGCYGFSLSSVNELRTTSAPSLAAVSSTSVKVTLPTYSLVTGYNIYRSTSASGPWEQVGTGTSGTVTVDAIYGKTNYYSLRPYNSVGSSAFLGAYSPSSAIFALSTPSITKIEAASSSSAKLTIKGVANASGYEIWRSATSNGTYSKLSSTIPSNATTYTATIPANTTSYIKIRGYKTVGSNTYYGPFSNIVNVTLGLPATKLNNPSAISSTAARLTWSAVANATDYVIYRSLSSSGPWNQIAIVTTTAYNDYSLTYGKINYYKVVARKNGILGDNSNIVDIFALSTPTMTSITNDGESGVKLTWKGVANTTGHRVYRSTNAKTGFELVADTHSSDVVYSNYSQLPGVTYYYQVQAYHTESGKSWYSQRSGIMSCMRTYAGPTITDIASVSSTSVKLTWTYSNYAAGYEILRCNSANGTYSVVATINNVETTTATVAAEYNKVNYYKVRAFGFVDGKRITGNLSPYADIFPLSTPGITSAPVDLDGKVRVSWNGVANVTEYNLYRSTSKTGSYSLVDSVPRLWYEDDTVWNTDNYWYKVQAYREVNGTWYSSPMSVPYHATLAAPTMKTCTSPDANKATITFTPGASKVDGYKVYRANDTTSGKAMIATIPYNASTTTYTFTDTTPVSSYTNYYWVTGYTKSGNGSLESAYSNCMSCFVFDTIAINSVRLNSESSVTLGWSAANDVTSYNIWRSTVETGTYTKIGSSKTTSYTDNSVGANVIYFYRIQPIYNNYSGNLTPAFKVPVMASPKLTITSDKTTCKAYLNWSTSNGATQYSIYRTTDLNAGYTYLATSTTNSYTDTSVVEDTVYYYIIRPLYKIATDWTLYGIDSSSVAFLWVPATTITLYPVSGSESAYLVWGAVSKANGYEIYICDTPAGTYSKLTTITNATVHTVNDLSVGYHYFKLRAYRTINNVSYYGDFSPVVNILILDQPAFSGGYAYQSRTAAQVSWGRVENADGYILYRSKNSANFTETNKIATITNGNTVTYEDSGLEAGATYYYAVSAYHTVNGTPIESPLSSSFSVSMEARQNISSLTSAHPYAPNMDQTWTYTIPGAHHMIVTFADATWLENGTDYIEITDSNGTRSYTGTDLAGQSINVSGQTLTIRMTSDASTQGYGFSVTNIVPYSK